MVALAGSRVARKRCSCYRIFRSGTISYMNVLNIKNSRHCIERSYTAVCGLIELSWILFSVKIEDFLFLINYIFQSACLYDASSRWYNISLFCSTAICYKTVSPIPLSWTTRSNARQEIPSTEKAVYFVKAQHREYNSSRPLRGSPPGPHLRHPSNRFVYISFEHIALKLKKRIRFQYMIWITVEMWSIISTRTCREYARHLRSTNAH